jgi:hypothetical protein
LVEPKSERVAAINVIAARGDYCVARHRVRQKKERLLAGPQWQESGFVFTTQTGRPIEPSNLTKDFKRVLKKAETT